MIVVAQIMNPDEIAGQNFGGRICNPVQDINANWVISMLEADYLSAESFEPIEWQPPTEQQQAEKSAANNIK